LSEIITRKVALYRLPSSTAERLPLQPENDEKFVTALRRIALMGGLHDYVAMSSRELGDMLEMSQQSASKRILELLDGKLIERDLGARRTSCARSTSSTRRYSR
jgi:hypothetical protein